MNQQPVSADSYEQAQRQLTAVCAALEGVIVGQTALVRDLVTAVFAGGHVLLEGLPGLGKTQLAKAMAATLGLEEARIQCTPDLMPADVTGSEVLMTAADGSTSFVFRRGPLFAQLVLVDEINRATPRTQSALLEAMQEMQVTHGGSSHALPSPFCVLATQNPIELEGTYPLPEAQLDRFMFKLAVPYPDAESLRSLLDVALDQEPSGTVRPLLAAGKVVELQALSRTVLVAERCKQATVKLVLATQPTADIAATDPRRHIRYGASPRALQALVRAARVRAVMAGRSHLDVSDIADVALPVLRHRVLLRLESELEGQDVNQLLDRIIGGWQASL